MTQKDDRTEQTTEKQAMTTSSVQAFLIHALGLGSQAAEEGMHFLTELFDADDMEQLLGIL